jgi:hypothetical protein
MAHYWKFGQLFQTGSRNKKYVQYPKRYMTNMVFAFWCIYRSPRPTQKKSFVYRKVEKEGP